MFAVKSVEPVHLRFSELDSIPSCRAILLENFKVVSKGIKLDPLRPTSDVSVGMAGLRVS